MELWIRSQDKNRLFKVNKVDIDLHLQRIIVNGEFFMGIYKTNERCIEILDEIQKLIKPIIINTKYNCEIKDGHNKNEFDLVMQSDESKLEIIQPTTIVYEMPKE